MVFSIAWLSVGFAGPDGERCRGAASAVSERIVVTSSTVVQVSVPPDLYPGQHVEAYEGHTTRTETPTACAVAAQDRALTPTIVLLLSALPISMAREVDGWRRHPADPPSRLRGEAAAMIAAGWAGVAAWLFAIDASPLTALNVGGLFTVVGLATRTVERGPEYDFSVRNVTRFCAAPTLWIGIGALAGGVIGATSL